MPIYILACYWIPMLAKYELAILATYITLMLDKNCDYKLDKCWLKINNGYISICCSIADSNIKSNFFQC